MKQPPWGPVGGAVSNNNRGQGCSSGPNDAKMSSGCLGGPRVRRSQGLRYRGATALRRLARCRGLCRHAARAPPVAPVAPSLTNDLGLAVCPTAGPPDTDATGCQNAGRPLPPTPSSSLLPPAPPPPSGPPHPAPPAIRECQVPLLDSGSPHVMLDPPPDDEFSPNSYLLRACAPPPQPPSAGKTSPDYKRCRLQCLP
ncbi:hypothetical protein DPEC_G00227750 [Dallia pectoralis]|uniref:Uncharacterized protein n=1 Tax=Dallia pectoralis TaxID=75939 RepID=A0ACC2G1C0_DALPE|nr:hypothetical protein DPEC_G00227750 [Dallia pectoralis]